MYIDIGLIVPGGNEFHNVKIFRAYHKKVKNWKKAYVAKMPAQAHNSNNNNGNNNNNNNNSNNNNNNNNNNSNNIIIIILITTKIVATAMTRIITIIITAITPNYHKRLFRYFYNGKS